MPTLILYALACHILIVVAPLVDLRLYGPHPRANFTDLSIFFEHASKLSAAAIPYRDFVVEYPPLALPLFLLPRLMSGNRNTWSGSYHLSPL